MGDNDENMIPEHEVNKMLGEQAQKHMQHLNEQLQNKDRDHKLDNLILSVGHVDKKICQHVDDEKEEKDAVMKAIEKIGKERRQGEIDVHQRIDKMDDKFVKKTALRNYAILIISAVTLTTSFITFIGVKNSNTINDEAIAKIAKTVVIKLTEKK